MKQRSMDILFKIVTDSESSHDLSELASIYQVSTRTIKNDIKEINNFLTEISMPGLTINGKGYIGTTENLDYQAVEHALLEMNSYEYKLSHDERVMYIIVTLIANDSFISMGKIAEELCVTRMTILKDIESVKELLNNYGILFQIKTSRGMKIKYSEQIIRPLIVELFRSVTINNMNGYIQRIMMSKLGAKVGLDKFIDIIQDYEKQNGISYTDVNFLNLSLYLFVCAIRIEKGHIIEKRSKNFKLNNNSNLFLKFVQIANLPFFQSEMEYFCEYVDKNKLHPNSKTVTDLELCKMITFFLGEIGKEFQVPLQEDIILIESILNHIKTIDIEFSFDYKVEKDLSIDFAKLEEEVKRNIYIIERYLGVNFNHTMILSIVVHISASLIRNHTYTIRPSVLITCPGSMATGKLLEAQIRNYYDFDIKGVVTVDNVRNHLTILNENIDFIISPIQIPDIHFPIVVVRPLLTIEDLNRIQNQALKFSSRKTISIQKTGISLLNKMSDSLKYIRDEKEFKQLVSDMEEVIEKHKKRELKSGEKIRDMLKPENIRIDTRDMTWEEAIKEAGNILKNVCYGSRYILRVIENIRQYGFYLVVGYGIALAHAGVKDDVWQDGLSLFISPKGIQFGKNNKVYLLFFFSTVGEKDYLNLFQEIIKLGKKQDKIKSIIDCESIDEVNNLLCLSSDKNFL